MTRTAPALLTAALLTSAAPLTAQEGEAGDRSSSSTFDSLRLREIGPALTSGRIADFAVNPERPSEYYVATASGGVWRTGNGGTTYEPVFDGEGSYSVGVVTLDPSNPHVVWVGTGENNAQRSVGYGDGVYKSVNGGETWTRMGLETSEHVGAIVVHPDDGDVVYVAAQGPLWRSGGERGLYRTLDGGETWDPILEVSEHTGINEVVLDPRDPDVLYATAWQRARRVWTYIGGGPESAFYKSTDGGDSWTRVSHGLPSGDLGRIGICVSPADPDYVYAIIEANGEAGGFYRSTNRAGSFEKMSSFATSSNYYQEIVCDRFDRETVYAMDTWAQVTRDGGRTFGRFGERHKHVDNHALWQDRDDPDHFLSGNDGGIYETWDGARTWQFKPNLPVTQFYKVAVDRDEPFYGVYGGTQDNFSLGGPSRTISQHGIVNGDWYVTNGGDGFESQVDPTNPDIVYAQSQYGVLVRYDRRSGEGITIQPLPGPDEPALRWNWDAPLLISPHSPTRLYFSANRVFRSDDRGDSWTVISGDLSRGIDRNALPVMGRVWSVDAVAKNQSTSIYGNVVAFDESVLQENLLYAGTDDGLVHVTHDAGGSWSRYASFPGVPDRTYVNVLLASRHDVGTVFAAFNNHKNGDFRPYLLRSTDQGETWTSIASNLPERGSVYAVAEDPGDPELLFVGTEFGLFFTRDGGGTWTRLAGGLPTVAVRDLAIQEREEDLVLATFGRGIWVLDDYTPLRQATPEILASEAHLFPVRDALAYVESTPLGLPDKSFQGESYYTASNPPFGPVFTWYLKEALRTRAERRREAEKAAAEAGETIRYPDPAEARAEDDEVPPYLLFTVADESGSTVRRIRAEARRGVNRTSWDLRYPPTEPVDLSAPGPPNPFAGTPQGPLVAPGTYTVTLSTVVDGVPTEVAGPRSFRVVPLNNAVLAAADREALLAFQREAGSLFGEVMASRARLEETEERLRFVDEAVRLAPAASVDMIGEVRGLQRRLADLRRRLTGDSSLSRRQFETPPSIVQRIRRVIGASYSATAAPGPAQREQVRIVEEALGPVEAEAAGVAADLASLEARLEEIGAPHTPGRRDSL